MKGKNKNKKSEAKAKKCVRDVYTCIGNLRKFQKMQNAQMIGSVPICNNINYQFYISIHFIILKQSRHYYGVHKMTIINPYCLMSFGFIGEQEAKKGSLHIYIMSAKHFTY